MDIDRLVLATRYDELLSVLVEGGRRCPTHWVARVYQDVMATKPG